MERREFFKAAAICGAASSLPKAIGQETNATQEDSMSENGSMNEIPLAKSAGTRKGEMLYRMLGKTGEQVSAIGMGGFHLGQKSLTDDASFRLIRSATAASPSWTTAGTTTKGRASSEWGAP